MKEIDNLDNVKLIKKLTDKDIGENEVKIKGKYELRKASRGIIINKDGKIAILNKKNKNEFKLVGGGVDEGEDFENAFLRESMEEAGCKVEIIELLGYTEEIKSHINFKQISLCYVAKVLEDINKTNFTTKEIEEGAQILWLDVKEAYEKIKKSYVMLKGSRYDNLYATKFIQKRDIEILKEYMRKNDIDV